MSLVTILVASLYVHTHTQNCEKWRIIFHPVSIQSGFYRGFYPVENLWWNRRKIVRLRSPLFRHLLPCQIYGWKDFSLLEDDAIFFTLQTFPCFSIACHCLSVFDNMLSRTGFLIEVLNQSTGGLCWEWISHPLRNKLPETWRPRACQSENCQIWNGLVDKFTTSVFQFW